MANSIMSSMGPQMPNAGGGNGPFNNQVLQQFLNFKKNYTGNPKQAVMQMLSQGQINNGQLQQVMQMAKQFQKMLK